MNLPFARIAKYLAIGLEIPAAIIGPLVVGYFIDQRLDTLPWITVGAAILGFFGAVYRLMQYLKFFSRERDGG